MKLTNMVSESFECVKINGILRNLTNDELRIYKKVKNDGKVFKADLSEYDANVATSMVSKGLLRRKKAQQENGKHGRLYFVTRGRKGHLAGRVLDEVAPPSKKSESWIKKNKKRFKEKYGKDYGKYLYGKAWNDYNGKVNESYQPLMEMVSYTPDELMDSNVTLDEGYLSSYTKSEIIQEIQKFINIYEEKKSDDDKLIIEFDNNDAFAKNNLKLMSILFDNRAVFDDLMDEAWDQVKEGANDSGEFTQYTEGEINTEATWDRISEEGHGELAYRYLSGSEIIDYYDNLLNVVKEHRKNLQDMVQETINSTITWDGSEEDTQQPQQPQNTELLNKIKSCDEELKAFEKKLTQLINDREYSSSTIDNIHTESDDVGYNNSDLLPRLSMELDGCFDDFRARFEQEAYDSGDFYVRDEDEVDYDATWDEIASHSFDVLFNNCGSYHTKQIRKVVDNYYSYLVVAYKKLTIDDGGDNMPTGEEFDESVLYETDYSHGKLDGLNMDSANKDAKVSFGKNESNNFPLGNYIGLLFGRNESNNFKLGNYIDLLYRLKKAIDKCLYGNNGGMSLKDFYTYLFDSNFIEESHNVDADNFKIDDEYLLDKWINEVEENLREKASDSGDYTQYYEEEYDEDATYSYIRDNYEAWELNNYYVPDGDLEGYKEDLIKLCKDVLKEVENINNGGESYWDGSEEGNTTTSNTELRLVPIVEKAKELIRFLQTDTKLNNRNSYKFVIDGFDELISSLRNNVSMRIGDKLSVEKESIFSDMYDSGMQEAINSGNDNQYREAEVDSEATDDYINSIKLSKLYKAFGLDDEDVRLEELNGIISTLLYHYYQKNRNLKSTGEEYNECLEESAQQLTKVDILFSVVYKDIEDCAWSNKDNSFDNIQALRKFTKWFEERFGDIWDKEVMIDTSTPALFFTLDDGDKQEAYDKLLEIYSTIGKYKKPKVSGEGYNEDY